MTRFMVAAYSCHEWGEWSVGHRGWAYVGLYTGYPITRDSGRQRWQTALASSLPGKLSVAGIGGVQSSFLSMRQLL